MWSWWLWRLYAKSAYPCVVDHERTEPTNDLASAHWLTREVSEFRGRVRDVVPATFRAFARVASSDSVFQVSLLRDVLTSHTQGRACWFALWDGWPSADSWVGAQTFSLPHRDYLLFHGSLDMDPMAFAGDDRGPSLWWPDDQAWVVASDVDSDATYVAGSSDLLNDLQQTEGLSVTEVQANDALTLDE